MAGAPNYAKGRTAMRRMGEGKARAFAQNIIVRDGKGKYPKCLGQKLYYFCHEEVPSDPKNVPRDCKFCQEYLKSKFYEETTGEKRLKRIQALIAEMSKGDKETANMIRFTSKKVKKDMKEAERVAEKIKGRK